MIKKVLFVPVLVLSVFLAGCDADMAPDSASAGKAGSKAAVSSNHFGFSLYEKLKEKDGNHFFSPFSVFAALSMAAEGASGNTSREMRGTLSLIEDDGQRLSAFSDLIKSFNRADRAFKLKTVNDLWIEETMKPSNSYSDVVKKYYHSGMNARDFRGRPEEARVEINSDIERRTEKRIKNILPAGSVDSDTRLIITNAIYFKADWLRGFEAADTRKRDFYVSPGSPVKVDMMNRKIMGVIEDYYGKAKVLELPYAGKEASMLIFLPGGGGIKELEGFMAAEKYDQWLASRGNREIEIDLDLPKFSYAAEYGLKNALAALGMDSAFSPPAADFSGITGSRDLYISDVVHKAFVDVNEEGTEAAAATGVVMKAVSAPPPAVPFTVDRPFIFMIVEKETGAVLFMGRVVNPQCCLRP